MKNTAFGIGVFLAIVSIYKLLTTAPMKGFEDVQGLEMISFGLMLMFGGILIVYSIWKNLTGKAKPKKR